MLDGCHHLTCTRPESVFRSSRMTPLSIARSRVASITWMPPFRKRTTMRCSPPNVGSVKMILGSSFDAVLLIVRIKTIRIDYSRAARTEPTWISLPAGPIVAGQRNEYLEDSITVADITLTNDKLKLLDVALANWCSKWPPLLGPYAMPSKNRHTPRSVTRRDSRFSGHSRSSLARTDVTG